MDYHPLQIVALIPLGLYITLIAFGVFLAVILFFFGDKIESKGFDSRLIRWPKAIKDFWNYFWDCVETLSDGHKARRAVREIVSLES